MLQDTRSYSICITFQCPECKTANWRVYSQWDWQCIFCTDNTPGKNLRYSAEYLRGFNDGVKSEKFHQIKL